MNKRGVTIIELLISISLISIIILLLIKVMFSLVNINNDTSYASDDEITRTEIIKKIESDFLNLKIIGINTNENTIEIYFEETKKTIKIKENKLIYDNTEYTLKSKNASYQKCSNILYTDLDQDYYLLTITIPVLINNENNTSKDDIILNYIGLKKENNHFYFKESCPT